MIELNDLVAQPWPWRNIDLLGFVPLLCVLALQFFKGFEARLGLGLPTFGVLPYPLKLALDRFLTCLFRLAFLLESLFRCLKPSRVVTHKRATAATV